MRYISPVAVGILIVFLVAPASRATLTLTPPSPDEYAGTSAADGGVVDQRGDYITALSTFSISGLGIEADPLQSVLGFRATIYAASGFSRGAVLATATVSLADIGQAFYDVPIGFTF